MGNEALDKTRAAYAKVATDYIAALEQKGLSFAERNEDARRTAELRRKLAARGAQMRNAGASISTGYLSPACVECTGSRGSETFSTTFKCHKSRARASQSGPLLHETRSRAAL